MSLITDGSGPLMDAKSQRNLSQYAFTSSKNGTRFLRETAAEEESMAATVSAWSKPGAWALDAEENEAELLKQHKEDSAFSNGKSNGGETADFPSLAAAASTKAKKKKPQTLSLQQFTTYTGPKPVSFEPKGLTPEEMLILPTGPRQRSAEELDRSKSGGFKFFGGGMRDEQPRRQGSFNRELAPSRADEIDNWAMSKKSPAGNGFERRERGDRGGFFSDSQSRADEVDNWASKKSFVPSEPRRNERRGGFGSESSNGGADSDNWMKRKEEEGRRSGGAFDSLRERRGVLESNGADAEVWGRKREEGSVGNGGGRPRMNLQPRTLPFGEGLKDDVESLVKPKGSSPFGDARPREEVLKEKGQDWKETEEKLHSTKIKDVGFVDGPPAGRRSFWSGNGRDRLQHEDKEERAWRKPDSVDSRPQSAGESNGHAENSENGHFEEAEEEHAQM